MGLLNRLMGEAAPSDSQVGHRVRVSATPDLAAQTFVDLLGHDPLNPFFVPEWRGPAHSVAPVLRGRCVDDLPYGVLYMAAIAQESGTSDVLLVPESQDASAPMPIIDAWHGTDSSLQRIGTVSSGEFQVYVPPLRIGADFIDGILEKTGFPITDHNRVAVRAMVHVMLRNKAYDYICFDKPESLAAEFVNAHPLRGASTALDDLQAVINDVAAVQPACSPYMYGEPLQAEEILLEVAEKGGGMFERGRGEPLHVYGE
jgi:hypothetical protein